MIKAGFTAVLVVTAPAVEPRLMPAAQMRIKRRSTLGPGQRFVLEAGRALFDHHTGEGEIEIDARQALDTAFSVSADADSGASVAVVTGTQGVIITSTVGTAVWLGPGQEIESDAAGNMLGVQAPTSTTINLWESFAPDLDVPAPVPGPERPTSATQGRC
ncbi:MAG TPA: hypothetical protein VM536_06950 [Chloroflexia bacterium]|nr:hypothetical protein [Chloroflexia bacterium]